jgi:aminoglycoside phosphotransferase (APT) family kinase protein
MRGDYGGDLSNGRAMDLATVAQWYAANLSGLTPVESIELLAGGLSNLTYRVVHRDGSSTVLRRPPLTAVLATAHDMGREYRIITALATSGVAVPVTFGYCEDASVIGAPFYVMEFVEGVVMETEERAAQFEPALRRVAAHAYADELAALHRVDPGAVGLGDLSRPDHYVERQLKRWAGQLERMRLRPTPDLDRVHAELSAAVPEQREVGIVHGDYRLANCMIGRDGAMKAILDWELCTLGEPRADVGFMIVNWPQTPRQALATPATPSLLDGFPTAAEMAERYESALGRPVEDLAYFVAFSYWRLACIVVGVHSRAVQGAQAGKEIDLAGLEVRVAMLTELGAEASAAL